MSWWNVLFGGGVAQTATAIGNAVDAVTTSDEERGAQVLQEGAQTQTFAAPAGDGAINDLVNAFNRLIRPGVTTWLFGGFAGWWKLPDPSSVDPFYQQCFYIVLTFWFGGRLIMKDLPAMIAAIAELRAKLRKR